MKIPVKLRTRSGNMFLLSIPKKFSDDNIINNKGLIPGNDYILELIDESKPPIIKSSPPLEVSHMKRVEINNKSKGMVIHIPLERDFAEKVIDNEYQDLDEMERETKIDDLVEALDYMLLRYDDETGKLSLDEEELR